MSAEELAQQAMSAINQGNAKEGKEALLAALALDPDRLDLRHALTVTQLQLGEPLEALQTNQDAYELALELADESSAALLAQIVLTRAAIYEDLAQPGEAEAAYREVLENAPDHPSAQQGLGYLLLAWGRTDEGVALLSRFAENPGEAVEFRDATAGVLEALARFRREDIHPKELLTAHRGSYVEFFDHHAEQMKAKGWIAEAAKMKRDGDRLVPSIPPGARPYAAVRVDLVDPATGQAGLVGEEPMIVAIGGYEPLAHAPILFATPSEAGFQIWTSTQAPWDQLPIQIRFAGDVDLDRVDAVIGDWYTAGFSGDFGSHDRGRLHYISDPERFQPDAVAYHVDCGRAELSAIDTLLRRLAVLSSQVQIRHVVIGRGFLPV